MNEKKYFCRKQLRVFSGKECKGCFSKGDVCGYAQHEMCINFNLQPYEEENEFVKGITDISDYDH